MMEADMHLCTYGAYLSYVPISSLGERRPLSATLLMTPCRTFAPDASSQTFVKVRCMGQVFDKKYIPICPPAYLSTNQHYLADELYRLHSLYRPCELLDTFSNDQEMQRRLANG
jgi:hypothetical protein